MSTAQALFAIATLAVSACALAGVFLVLRRMAMMADAISHSILPGLVAGYVLARGPGDIAGFFGAAAAGLLTVFLVETLTRSRRLKEDAAIGVVFPAMFALGVFVVSRHFAHVHLDADAILVGDLEWATLQTLEIGGRAVGLQAVWVLGGLTLLNALFLALFYKELKVSTFDPELAASIGFRPGVLHYALMAVVAVTTVGAFNAVGAIMTVALLIVPAATASLLTARLLPLIVVSLVVGVGAAFLGVALALHWDVQTSGMIASALGALFALTLLFSPRQGLVAQSVRRRSQQRRFKTEMLVVHLLSHEGTLAQAEESRASHLEEELDWRPEDVRQTIIRAREGGLIHEDGDQLTLTDKGRATAGDVRDR